MSHIHTAHGPLSDYYCGVSFSTFLKTTYAIVISDKREINVNCFYFVLTTSTAYYEQVTVLGTEKYILFKAESSYPQVDSSL